MKVWVVSHGGVGSKSFATFIKMHGFRVMTQAWHGYLCHAPRPVDGNGIRLAVYIYGDPILSICSMKQQGNAELNLRKLTDNAFAKYSDVALLKAIYEQFRAFTTRRAKGYPTLLFKYEDAFNPVCLEKLRTHLPLKRMMTKRFFRKREVSYRSICLKSLDIPLDLLHLAGEMFNYQSDCTINNGN